MKACEIMYGFAGFSIDLLEWQRSGNADDASFGAQPRLDSGKRIFEYATMPYVDAERIRSSQIRFRMWFGMGNDITGDDALKFVPKSRILNVERFHFFCGAARDNCAFDGCGV